jgi:hypothetical protein
VGLKRAHHRSTSSKRWFRGWWKQDHLHKIKTKQDRRKKSRLEKSVKEEEDDEDCEFVVDKFDDEEDFIPFEDEDEGENAPHAENAGQAGHDNLRTNHSIDDEFNQGDFFDRMDDERDFQTLYS